MPGVIIRLAEAGGRIMVRHAEIGKGQVAGVQIWKSVNRSQAEVSITLAEDEPKG